MTMLGETLKLATTIPSKSLDNDKVNVSVMTNGTLARGLIDTGAKNNHADFEFCRRIKLSVSKSVLRVQIDFVVKGSSVKSSAHCSAHVDLLARK